MEKEELSRIKELLFREKEQLFWTNEVLTTVSENDADELLLALENFPAYTLKDHTPHKIVTDICLLATIGGLIKIIGTLGSYKSKPYSMTWVEFLFKSCLSAALKLEKIEEPYI